MKKRKYSVQDINMFETMVKFNIIVLSFIILLAASAIIFKFYKFHHENKVQKMSIQDEEKSNILSENNAIESISDITDWNLILVNKNNKVPENYEVKLKEIENMHQVDERIYENLKNMLTDARNEGLDPIICSSYRTYDKQTNLYNNKVNEYIKKGYNIEKSKELASFWVAIPGTGEHETGLAVDIVSNEYQVLDEEQEHTGVQKWLIDNSYKYGFTLRYPTSKKEITMINYEPWHYRYVGIENATIMKEKNMCLEEYIEYLKKQNIDSKKLV